MDIVVVHTMHANNTIISGVIRYMACIYGCPNNFYREPDEDEVFIHSRIYPWICQIEGISFIITTE